MYITDNDGTYYNLGSRKSGKSLRLLLTALEAARSDKTIAILYDNRDMVRDIFHKLKSRFNIDDFKFINNNVLEHNSGARIYFIAKQNIEFNLMGKTIEAVYSDCYDKTLHPKDEISLTQALRRSKVNVN